ncbi:MAG: NAD(P)-dependent oxidoreductase [Bacteroidetes bacterium]|nr:MAG: NAD(P)-dependent oxidoreductase [Bacteroidota bacterium]
MPFALITGASTGIGKCIAEELAARDYDVLLIARSECLLKENCLSIQKKYSVSARYFAIDLAEENAAQKIYNWCQSNNYQVSILVNNAGYGLSGFFENRTCEANFDMLKVNMTTPVQLCQLFLPMLKLKPRAYILNIGSTAAYQAMPGFALYGASKSFILNFTRGLHAELKDTNISVSCVCPGATNTHFNERSELCQKAIAKGEKLSMSAEKVAQISVEGMFSGKTEVVVGLANRVGVFLSWLLPKSVSERFIMNIYKE